MIIAADLRDALDRLYSLVRTQRLAQLAVRCLWLFGAGWIAGWAAREHFDWGVDWRVNLIGGALFALFGILTYGRYVSDRRVFTWRLERRLRTQEVLSAALELDDDQPVNPITEQLLDEVHDRLWYAQRRVSRKGWYFGGDIDSLVVIVILFAMIQISSLSFLPTIAANPATLKLPGLGAEPSADAIFPSGIPGVEPEQLTEAGVPPQEDGDSFSADSGEDDLSGEDLGEIGEALEQLGEELSEQAATAELGEALQQGDLDRAAEDLGDLAGQTGGFSEETREAFSEALEDAGEHIEQQTEANNLSDALREASDGVASGQNEGEALDNLAQALQAIAQQAAQQASEEGGIQTASDEGTEQEGDSQGATAAGVGSSTLGAVEDFDRLTSEGDTLDLSGISDENGLLQPGPPLGTVEGLSVGGVFNYLAHLSPGQVESILAPYRIDWSYRDLISRYFTPGD